MQRSQQGETDVSNCCAFDRDGEPDPNSRRSAATAVCHDEPAGDRTWAVDRAGRTHKDAASLQRWPDPGDGHSNADAYNLPARSSIPGYYTCWDEPGVIVSANQDEP